MGLRGKSVRAQAQGSEILPCLDQGVLCFLFPVMYLLWWRPHAWFRLQHNQTVLSQTWQLGMGDSAVWTPGWFWQHKGQHLALSEVSRRGHGWQCCPRTPNTVHSYWYRDSACGNLSDTSISQWHSTVWWYQCHQFAQAVCKAPSNLFPTTGNIMDVLSSPGHEPYIRLSFLYFFSVHGVCLGCLCYLDTWDMT